MVEDVTGGFEGGGSDPELLYPAASVMAIPLVRKKFSLRKLCVFTVSALISVETRSNAATWRRRIFGGTLMKRIMVVAFVLTFCFAVSAQQNFSAANSETKAQHDQRMRWWREARFGMFIH